MAKREDEDRFLVGPRFDAEEFEERLDDLFRVIASEQPIKYERPDRGD